MTLKPRILPITQGTIVDIPHTAERLVQVNHLIRRWIEAVAIGTVGHLQNIQKPVIFIKSRWIDHQGTALQQSPRGGLPRRPLSLPGLKAGVSRGKSR